MSACLPLPHAQELYERKRQEAQQRESQRWQQMEAERAREEARVTAAREQGLGSKSNQSSEHFNIISLDYHATKEGAQLRYKVRASRPAMHQQLQHSMHVLTTAAAARAAAAATHAQDDVTRYRAVLRSQNLFNKSHSVPHNIITGELRHNLVELPSAPAPPC